MSLASTDIQFEIVDHRAVSLRGTCHVTVLCTTYNHERYIEQCLDSLVKQDTDFPYLVFVHDDNSTDGTQDILHRYAKQYPDKIVLFLEKQNLYKKGISIARLIEPYFEGDFIALCEGDDWWLSSRKLQSQYNYLSQHPNVALCVHSGALFDERIRRYVGVQKPRSEESDFATEEVILGGGGLFVTNSMMFKRSLYVRPAAYLGWGIGDYPLCIYCSVSGVVHYLPEVMSAYRIQAIGSWSAQKLSSKEKETRFDKLSRGLLAMDKATGYKFHTQVKYAIEQNRLKYLVRLGDWARVKSEVSPGFYAELSVQAKLKAKIKCCFPNSIPLFAQAKWLIPQIVRGQANEP